MKGFLRIVHTNNFIVILCMAIMLSPLFFVMNSYAEGSNVASSSITRKVNVASGSDASFDDEEIDDEEEDNLTDYPEEPEDDIDENTGDNSDGEPQNDSYTSTSNLGNASSSSDPSADLSSDSSTVDPDTASTSSSSDSSNGSATEHTNDLGSNTSNASNQNLATSSDADETTNESEPEEQTSNTNNNATKSTPSNIVPKLGLAPSVPFVPLGAGTNFLTLTALENNTKVKFKYVSGESTKYSINDGTWMDFTSYGMEETLNKNDYIKFKGKNITTNLSSHFELKTNKIKLSGSVTSLTDETGISESVTLTPSCYKYMFADCTSIVSIDSGLLPAKTLKPECYANMFYGCTSLTTAPALPATSLADKCYENMFYGCTSLTTAPALSATSLANNCYYSMFTNCTSLTTAPTTLPATSLANSCYSNMFNGCTSLTAAPKLPAISLSNGCYSNMFKGCTSIEIPPNLPATTLADFCYENMFDGCTNLILKDNPVTNRPWKIPATSGPTDWNNNMFANCDNVYLGGTDPKACMLNTTYYTKGSATPTPAPPSGGGGSSGGGGGGGSIDPAGKPLDPQIVSPGIVTNLDPLVNPNTNVIPGTPAPSNTKVNINYDSSVVKKVVVSKPPSVTYGDSGNSDNLQLQLTGKDGVTYIADFGFYDVELRNENVDQNGTIDTYYVNEASNLVTGWIETANKNRYFMENAEINNGGKMCHGWKRIVNDWYYFDYDGKMMRDTKTYDGFTVDKDGKMTNPAYLDKALINGKQKRTVYTMEKGYRHD